MATPTAADVLSQKWAQLASTAVRRAGRPKTGPSRATTAEAAQVKVTNLAAATTEDEVKTVARELGTLLACRIVRYVYGGGNSGGTKRKGASGGPTTSGVPSDGTDTVAFLTYAGPEDADHAVGRLNGLRDARHRVVWGAAVVPSRAVPRA